MTTNQTIKPFREIKNNQVELNLHWGQTKVDRSLARFVAMIAGTQGGKTCYGPHWLYDRIKERGEGDYLAVTATFPLLNLKMLPEFLEVFQHIYKLGEYKVSDKIFLFKDGKTKVFFMSADKPESLESATAKAAWLDECGQKQFKREAWDAVQRRVSKNKGRVLFTTTPYVWGWFKNEVYDSWRDGDKDFDVIQFESTANPSFPPEEFERLRARWPKWKFDMFCRGQFSKPAGVVYESFNEAVCKIKRFPIPDEWPIYVGHDFGTANPAALFYAQDPATGYFYLFHEYLPGKKEEIRRSTAQHVNEFKKIVGDRNVIKRVGGSHQEEGWRGDFTAHGWPIVEPKLDRVEPGIDRVFGLHKLNKVYVFNDMYKYLDEKTSYSYELDESDNPTNRIEDKEKFHLMDAERYILSDFMPETVVGVGRIKVYHTLENYGRVRAW